MADPQILVLNFNSLEVFLSIMIFGIFTGLGTSIGSYVAQKHLIAKMEQLIKFLKGRKHAR